MNWREMYKQKVCSSEEAVSLVKSGDKVVFPLGNGIPVSLLEALAERSDMAEVEIYGGLEIFPLKIFNAEFLQANPQFKYTSLYSGIFIREAIKKKVATYLPVRLAQGPEIVEKDHMVPEVLMLTVSPMDKHGFFSCGSHPDFVYPIIRYEKHRHIIVQVSENTPRTWGDNHIHISEIDKIVEFTQPLLELPDMPASPEEELIGQYTADMVPDGATIQLGIGGVPSAVARLLKEKKDLGVHSEMLCDAMVELYEAGVINNSKKNLKKGKMVGTFAVGTRKLYDFIDDNPLVEMFGCTWVNNPFVIAQNDNVISINSALEVDMTGQVNAESLGNVHYSGTGGFIDFMQGAWYSKGGKSFITLTSTYNNSKGEVKSRIIPMLPHGATVTGQRAEIQYIVTEYGVAEIKGRNFKQRAESLINIAHPDFRDRLRFELDKLNI